MKGGIMDPITQELTSLILKTDVTRRPDLAEAGRRAFADYLASALAGSRGRSRQKDSRFPCHTQRREGHSWL